MRIIAFLFFVFFYFSYGAIAQGYWQQRVQYSINVELDTATHQLQGYESLFYINNSPKTLKKVYFHLYLNAFQPGSMMDVRSRNISDPDRRVGDRISKLSPEEQGFQKIEFIQYNNQEVEYSIEGTLMTVYLNEPIGPGEMGTFDIGFTAQIPVQIRRTGRNNSEGIDYTVTQWYPKMAEFDEDGWHTEEYIGREFYGPFGSFDVTILIDYGYTVAATGTIQNPNAVGHGYGSTMAVSDEGKVAWRFSAENVHDFAWAADENYTHDIVKVDNELDLHFFYVAEKDSAKWAEVKPKAVEIFKTTNMYFGRYPYKNFSIIQGGDGGMEYPMCTMILASGNVDGLVGLIAHEAIHSWYYGVLASNEFRYPWMDEGMTTYAEEFAMDKLYNRNGKDFLKHEYDRYDQLLAKNPPIEEPMATPADLFNTNFAYSVSSYSKGAITLNMLRYIMGDAVFYRAMMAYYNGWKFRHPTPNDFWRLMESQSGLELDWFFQNWLYTLHHLDYGVKVSKLDASNSVITLNNYGEFPMPIDLVVTKSTGEQISYYIPLRQMRGTKKTGAETLESWAWVNPEYSFEIPIPVGDIAKVEIDPQHVLPDVNLSNNTYPASAKKVQAEESNQGKRKKKK